MMPRLVAVLLLASCNTGQQSPTERDVEVRFAARVGPQAFQCGQSYDGVGRDKRRIWPTDLRFYVHGLQLRSSDGDYVDVALAAKPPYQGESVAMLDFEDASGNCATGTSTTNDVVLGKVPSGEYRGLRFRVGVPEALNHVNGDEADDPLNNSGVGSGMLWVWLTGYKFFKLDFALSDKKEGDFSVHVGSMACGREGETPKCLYANRPLVELDDFSLSEDVVTLDVAAALAELSTDDPANIIGCHSVNDAPACWATMPQFGLDFGFDDNGVPRAPGKQRQVVFSTERAAR